MHRSQVRSTYSPHVSWKSLMPGMYSRPHSSAPRPPSEQTLCLPACLSETSSGYLGKGQRGLRTGALVTSSIAQVSGQNTARNRRNIPVHHTAFSSADTCEGSRLPTDTVAMYEVLTHITARHKTFQSVILVDGHRVYVFRASWT